MITLLQFDPIVYLHLGPLRVSPHGIATAVGFVAGARLLLPATRTRGIDDDLVYSMLYRAAIGALVGARLAYALNHFSEYSDDPLSALRIWEGGLSLFGGIAGGVLAAVPIMRRHRLPFWSLMDAAAPGLALGIAIGRVGDLIVGDHLGRPTSFLLAFECTEADTASPCVAPTGSGVHLPALYDLISATVLLAVLLVLRRRARREGFLILFASAWYGAGRFLEDFYRIDDEVAFSLSGSQISALIVVLVSLALLARRGFGRSTVSETPTPERDREPPVLGRRPRV